MSEVVNRPTGGVQTAGPDEPYVNSTSTVLWEPLPETGAATRSQARGIVSARDPRALDLLPRSSELHGAKS